VRRYSVGVLPEGNKVYYYIQDSDTLEIALLPTKYLKYKIESNRSPNTVKRSAYALCYYMDYMTEASLDFQSVCQLAYDEQNRHFVGFLYWTKEGNHLSEVADEDNNQRITGNGTCNAYLKDVFRFFLYLCDHGYVPALKVLSYNQITLPNAVGVKRVLRSRSFKGYLKERERNVRAAEEPEILKILQACTNCRDQLLILLIAETGFRIGEILGVDYTRDIDYQDHTIRVFFRDDNENGARAKNAEYRRAKISDDAFYFLLHYLSEYREVLQYQTYLFINIIGDTMGRPMKVDSVYDMLDRVEKKTGIKMTPHMIRRYFGNTRWNAGWPLELISQAYGHKHLDTTIRYLNILDDKLMEASKEFYSRHSVDYGIDKLL